MTSLLIKAGRILTMDAAHRVLEGGAILLSGPRIARVLDRDALQRMGTIEAETVDATTMTVVPGFVQTHVHLCQALFRGLAEDLDLLDWLATRIFPLEAAHTASSIDISARIGLAELVRSGTTTIMDMGSVHHQDVAVGAIEPQFYAELLDKLGLDAADLPSQNDITRWPELRAILTEKFASKDRDHWAKVFATSDACVTPVLSFGEVESESHNTERDTFYSENGSLFPAPAPRFSRTAPDTPRPPGVLGADTEAVLRDWV